MPKRHHRSLRQDLVRIRAVIPGLEAVEATLEVTLDPEAEVIRDREAEADLTPDHIQDLEADLTRDQEVVAQDPKEVEVIVAATLNHEAAVIAEATVEAGAEVTAKAEAIVVAGVTVEAKAIVAPEVVAIAEALAVAPTRERALHPNPMPKVLPRRLLLRHRSLYLHHPNLLQLQQKQNLPQSQ